jgi:hypothetical protein
VLNDAKGHGPHITRKMRPDASRCLRFASCRGPSPIHVVHCRHGHDILPGMSKRKSHEDRHLHGPRHADACSDHLSGQRVERHHLSTQSRSTGALQLYGTSLNTTPDRRVLSALERSKEYPESRTPAEHELTSPAVRSPDPHRRWSRVLNELGRERRTCTVQAVGGIERSTVHTRCQRRTERQEVSTCLWAPLMTELVRRVPREG